MKLFLFTYGVFLNIVKKVALYLLKKEHCRRAVDERADLRAFKEKLTTEMIMGIVMIAVSYVIGLPAVVALSVIAVWLNKPLIGFIGGPLIYGVSTLLFIIGIKMVGKKYITAVWRWFVRIILEKVLGDEIKTICSSSPDIPGNEQTKT